MYIFLIFNTCFDCHSKSVKDTLNLSVHKVFQCLDWHKNFEKTPHPEIKNLCERCHTDVVKFFKKSVHYNQLK